MRWRHRTWVSNWDWAGRRPWTYPAITTRSRNQAAKYSNTGWYSRNSVIGSANDSTGISSAYTVSAENTTSPKSNSRSGLAKNGKDYRYDGSYVGGGVSYGYQWMLARKWSLEATVGVGYVRFNYDKYPCYDCGQRLESGNKNYFGPTKVGINLIFVIN